MGGGSYKSVVERKSQALLHGQVGVDYVAPEGICLSKRAEQPLRLSLEIALAAYIDNIFIFKKRLFLAVAAGKAESKDESEQQSCGALCKFLHKFEVIEN